MACFFTLVNSRNLCNPCNLLTHLTHLTLPTTMIPAPFAYLRPTTMAEAIAALAADADAKVLAGGHSLIPAMKLRLAQPQTLIDLGRLTDVNYIREQHGKIVIGAMTTHHDIEA